jgi:hypothetical protein
MHLGRAELVQVVEDDGDRIRCQAQRGRHLAGQLLRGDRTRSDRRSASPARAGTTGSNPAATAHQNACGSSSASSRLTHTPFRPAFPARSHDAAKIVLPQPAAAATTVTGPPDDAVTSGCRRARETTSVTTGGQNFSAQYQPTVRWTT